MFCPNCGTNLEDGHVFCSACGASLQTSVSEDIPMTPDLPVTPKKSSPKKKILIITAVVTALALAIGAVAVYLVNNPTVYLRTKITQYDADGQWARTVEYEYNDQGSPTEIKITSPDYDSEEVWDEESKIYIYNITPNGGQRVKIYTYEYNDEGHCTYYDYVYKEYDSNGKVVSDSVDETVYGGCKYTYNDDGTIESIPTRGFELSGELGDYVSEYRYHYDDDGRLHEISSHYELEAYSRISVVAEYRYDSEDRLSASSCHWMEGAYIYEYEYDKDGRLETVSLSRDNCGAPMDDDRVTETTNPVNSSPKLQYEAEFEYDSKGNLLSREVYDGDGNLSSTVECEYDGKYLSRVEFDDYTVEITDDENEAEDMAEDMDEDDVVMVRDKHGNIVKAINSDGGYAEYEYEAVRLTKALASQHESTMFSLHGLDLFGRSYSQIYNFGSGAGFVSYVSFPTNELYDIEVLLKANY